MSTPAPVAINAADFAEIFAVGISADAVRNY